MMRSSFFLILLCSFTLLAGLARAEVCTLSSLKTTVREMRAQGLSRSERRQRLLPPLDIQGIAARVRRVGPDALAQLYLPELRPDVLWARTSIGDLEASTLSRVRNPSVRRRIRRNSATLRARLTALLADPRGISYEEWAVLSEYYMLFSRQAWDLAFDPTDVKLRSFAELQSKLSGRVAPRSTGSVNGYVAIPTVRRTDIPVLNEMMSRGTSPVLLTDRGVSLDGFDNVNPSGVYSHDRGHINGYGPRNTERAGLTPEQYFDEYRRQLSEQIHDDRMRRTIEAGWFLIHHEREGVPLPYGPRAIRQELADEAFALETYKDRLGPDDVGDYFPDGVPDERMIRQAHDWLRGFVQRIESQYPPAR